MSREPKRTNTASGLIGLWNSRVVMAPVLGATMNYNPSSSTSSPPPRRIAAAGGVGEESSNNVEGGSSYLKVEAGNKPKSSFTRFKQLDSSSSPKSNSPLLPSSPTSTPSKNSNTSSDSTEKKKFVSRSASSAKEVILLWVKETIKDYDSMSVTNFSSSWSDGLAFCALIHNFYPEAFDFATLKSENRRHNFELAFSAAEEYAGIYPLLEVDDMMKMKNPDWKCVFTYVQSFYRRFRNGREPPTPNKSLILNATPSTPSSSSDATRTR
ncbi:uncharacterized protein [Lepeophtheirus salmonis]|uniref:uncharacterized protein isoform X2 n=1 Tax=Lepeophtheirus salmonis TaxID=72036 RepID=UPI001AE42000|nr:smoothelin-like protein 1 isoform X2 [Lepeophtheirus salmonis]